MYQKLLMIKSMPRCLVAVSNNKMNEFRVSRQGFSS